MRSRGLLIGVSVFFALILNQNTFAQQLAPTAPPDHVHIYTPDPARSLNWYMKHFGGEKVKNGVLYGRTALQFTKSIDIKPSDGSVIDRVGFTVDNVDAKTTELTGDGAKLLQKGNAAFLQDPWGSKVEVLHPDGVPTKELFLLSLRATDPAPIEKWVADNFGGTPDKMLVTIDGIKYGDLWLIFQKSDTVPSRGRAIDHIGWAVPDVKAAVAAAKAKGIKVTAEPRKVGHVTTALIEGPDGLAVELTQTGSSR